MSDISQKGFDDARGCGAVRSPRGAGWRWEAFSRGRKLQENDFQGPGKGKKKKRSGRGRRRVGHRAVALWCNKCDMNTSLEPF